MFVVSLNKQLKKTIELQVIGDTMMFMWAIVIIYEGDN